MQREAMEFDVLIVGGGPAGLPRRRLNCWLHATSAKSPSVSSIKVPKSVLTSSPAP